MKATESFIKIDDVSFFLRRRQEFDHRPTIVFLHDSLGCVQLWRDFPEKLCAAVKCNMLAYDRQGYGKSSPMPTHHRTNAYMEKEADVLIDLLKRLEIRRAVLFGHSDGGSIALIAAGKSPDLFSAVVVEAAHLFVEEVTLNGIRAAVKDYAATNLKTRLEKYHGDKTETLFNAWTKTWLSESFRSWNIEHFLAGIKVPVMFVQGERDEYGTEKQMQAVAEHASAEVQLYLIPAAGHTPHREAQAAVMENVSAFLKGIF